MTASSMRFGPLLVDNARLLLDAFAPLDDWDLKYGLLIDMGRELPAVPEIQTPENQVHGCQSQVWLTHRKEDDRFTFTGDSDAFISRGLVALVIRLYSGLTREEILAFDFGGFLAELGLNTRLSMGRSRGLEAMVGRVRQIAVGNQ